MKQFKIRCSAISQIMAQPRAKKDKEAGLLGDTAKTYCQTWLKEQLYKRRKEFGSKQTEKGTIVEEQSLDYLINNNILPFALKNETFFENDYLTGTPDVISSECVVDLKNSWDAFSFPLFEQEITNKAYYYQLQGYMCLTGLKKAKLIYILSNTPAEFVEQEIYYATKDKVLSISETKAIHDKIKNYHNYDRFNSNLRVKQFEIEYNIDAVEQIYLQVEKCRNYIYKLLTNIK